MQHGTDLDCHCFDPTDVAATPAGAAALYDDPLVWLVRREERREAADTLAFALAYIRERTLDDLWGFCATCYYREPCRGGCTATAEPLLGRPGNNPFCHHRALAIHAQGLRERVEPVAPAPGVPFDHGYYRIVRESIDPDVRAREGPVGVDEPRVPRTIEPFGPGRPIADHELGTQ